MAPVDPRPCTDEEDTLRRYARALADGIEAAIPGWVERCVAEVVATWEPGQADALARPAAEAGRQAAIEVGGRVRSLLADDVDAQATGPLALVREAVAYPTRVLHQAGAPPAERDEFRRRAFPADVYDLAPAAFADLDPALHEPGLAWGAAKAYVVLSRRRAEGLR